MRVLVAMAAILCAAMFGPVHAEEAQKQIWERLKQGGYIVLFRHAQTVAGIGDPPGFRLEDCSTQRNLSGSGRDDARRIGDAFRTRSIPVAEVRASRWCRCLDTARLAFGSVVPDPMLDSIFREDEQESMRRTRLVQEALSRRPLHGNLIMVTHDQNIYALTGRSLKSGEMAVLQPGAHGLPWPVLATVPPDAL